MASLKRELAELRKELASKVSLCHWMQKSAWLQPPKQLLIGHSIVVQLTDAAAARPAGSPTML